MVVPYFINAIQCIPPVFDDGKAYDCFARVAKRLYLGDLRHGYGRGHHRLLFGKQK
jgi:hypothetical protein